jgi:hypothetical protein
MTHNSIEKFMLTTVWNPCGFHLIKVLEKRRKFNADYYYNPRTSLLEGWHDGPAGSLATGTATSTRWKNFGA